MMTLESFALALNNGLTSGHILARDKKTGTMIEVKDFYAIR